jgi:hypothetical protein
MGMVVMSKRELNHLDVFGAAGQRQINGSSASRANLVTFAQIWAFFQSVALKGWPSGNSFKRSW